MQPSRSIVSTAAGGASSLLLMPSARLIPLELQTEFGPIPSAMVPLGGRPAFHHIAEPYLASGSAALIAVGDRANVVSQYLERSTAPDIAMVDVGRTPSLGETLRQALAALESLPSNLIINFADTLLRDGVECEPAVDLVCFARPRDLHRWTCFSLDDGGRFDAIIDKNRPKPEIADLSTFVGVFRFADPARLLTELTAACAVEDETLDPFYRALAAYFEGRPVPLREVEAWSDLGHLDTYYRAKQTYWVNTRLFNRVAIDPSRGVVRKSSAHTEKFLKEINWYLRLPKNLQHLAPRLLDYSLDPGDAFVEMEFYGYPALNDMYLLGDYDLGLWMRVFEAIEDALARMHAERLPSEGPEWGTERSALHEIYEVKTRERLLEAVQQPHLAAFLAEDIAVNGRLCLGVPRVLDMLPQILVRGGLYDLDHFTVVHGDLCLSNLLFDPRNCFIRMIDPRGSFGPFDIYGDPRYDLAKLCHSFEGDYDFFVNDLFDLSWHGGGLAFKPHLAPRHGRVRELFRTWLRGRWGDVYPQIKLIEALLFLSMVPLHADRPMAQQAFLGRGLELFTQVAAFQGTKGASAADYPLPLGQGRAIGGADQRARKPLDTPPLAAAEQGRPATGSLASSRA